MDLLQPTPNVQLANRKLGAGDESTSPTSGCALAHPGLWIAPADSSKSTSEKAGAISHNPVTGYIEGTQPAALPIPGIKASAENRLFCSRSKATTSTRLG